jgi:hypothetical protein
MMGLDSVRLLYIYCFWMLACCCIGTRMGLFYHGEGSLEKFFGHLCDFVPWRVVWIV